MAQAPKFKIFDHNGNYQAACKEVGAAAVLMSHYGDGASIRLGHSKADTVWLEGSEECPAFESFDVVAETIDRKWRERNIAALRKLGMPEAEIQRMVAG